MVDHQFHPTIAKKLTQLVIFPFVKIVPKEDVIIKQGGTKVCYMHCFQSFLDIAFYICV